MSEAMTGLEAASASLPAGAGAVGLLSSDEFLPATAAFDRALLSVAGPRVAVLLAADPRAAPASASLALEHYRRLGADASVVPALHRDEMIPDVLPEFDVLFLAGGSPATLIEAVRGTGLWSEAVRRWRAGAALSGSSAGAMALCRHCLVPRPGDRMPTTWSEGLGPLDGVALAVHATSRPALWLRDVASRAPVPLLALGDQTGVVLSRGAPPILTGPGPAEMIATGR